MNMIDERRLKFLAERQPNRRPKFWFWGVLAYYVAANLLVTSVSCQYPFNKERLWFFGVTPLALAIVGLCVCRTQVQRVMAWIVFTIAVAGICISYQPLCLWLGLNTWYFF
jgi:hypothetical protein